MVCTMELHFAALEGHFMVCAMELHFAALEGHFMVCTMELHFAVLHDCGDMSDKLIKFK